MKDGSRAQISTADLYDAFHDRIGVCSLQFRGFGLRRSFCGPAETLVTFEDHTPVLNALSEEGRSRVLVVDAGGSLRVGVLGDRLAAIGAKNGWAGIVINGAIRDSDGIDALDIGVKALGVTARRNWSPTPGRKGVPLLVGDVLIEPGNWIYADGDAVLVAPAQLPETGLASDG